MFLTTIDKGPLIGLLILLGIILLFGSGFRIVPQSKAYIIQRLGRYLKTWESGLRMKLPIVDRIERVVDLKEQVGDFPPQPVITRDNVTMQIDTVVFFQITDPKLYTYGVKNPVAAIENLTATTLRNIIGELELDETLASRDVINTKMRAILDEATDPWGIKVSRVEVKNIIPPRDIQEAMEKQMRAERERRAAILTAEGQKESAIRIAEGEKQSQILRAEASKQAQILAAEAEKEAKIRLAEGEAEAILKVQQAQSEGIRLLNEAKTSKEVLTLKAYEAMAKIADGRSTKLIIPSEMQNLSGLIASATEIVKTTKEDSIEE